ncbi:hypothetical protein DESUT3_26810 [Desulfuromonas versatilis]|uniref:MscS Mechanosensitive ion channel n=1 Tax=Desulfuromonas versatilis TaxID=2802975 RepID=A0ABM8HYJ2_9BACT|nr:mechanosensitive ion channel domain-containing protein [Desulfuromonas versatilis]BCR05612.1 hypothetical protein DESUT3_26810 [Desulfuromonas versatilis]
MQRLFVLCLVLLALAAPAALAQQNETAQPAPSAEVSFPGVAEIVPRLAQLGESVLQADSRIASLQENAGFEGQIAAAQEKQQELKKKITEYGEMSTWSSDRLLEVRGRLLEHRATLRKLLDTLSSRLAELEALRKDWSSRKEFWEGWHEALKGSSMQPPKDSFRQARGMIEEILASTAKTSTPFVTLQQEVTTLQTGSAEILNQLETTLSSQRKELFKKTARSLASPDYYRQFNAELFEQVTQGISSAQGRGVEFLQEQGWILGLQLLLAAGLGVFIIRHGQRAQVTQEWQFILRHPFATGVFVAISSLSFLYTTPPGLWRLLLWSLAAFPAAVLISGLLRNPRKIFMVNLLAALLILSLALQIISLPQPLYRLYLAMLSLLGIPLLLILAGGDRRAKQGRSDGFTMTLRGGAAILAVSFVSQAAGYTNLASRLIEASVQTVFLGLFAAMAIRLGLGGIEFFWRQDFIKAIPFLHRFGHELEKRLKGVLKILVIGYALLQTLAVWGFYDTAAQAWSNLLEMGFSVGENNFSIQMVLLAAIALYLSLVVSKLLSAVLESEFIPRTGMDRGIGDSIRKLLHYVLVTIGFLIAIGIMGMELKNFAVLAGAFGIGIGFGLQNIVNNFVSGLILLFERPVKVGDTVVLGTDWGTVQKIGLRSTIVETFDRSEIIVPNSQLISDKVTNWTLTSTMARAIVPVGVAYGTDLDRVMEILKEAAAQHPEVLKDPEPAAIFMGFGESSLDFELRVWLADVGRRLGVRSDLGRYIEKRFREAGIEIPFPQRDLHLRSVEQGILERQGPPLPREAAGAADHQAQPGA